MVSYGPYLCSSRHIPWRDATAYSPCWASNHFRPHGYPPVTGHRTRHAYCRYLSGPLPTTPVPPAPTAGSSLLPSSSTGIATVNAISDSTMINLLPLAASHAPLPMAGVYVGEGLPPVPTKLASKILRWEYIEMAKNQSSGQVLSWRKRTRNVSPPCHP